MTATSSISAREGFVPVTGGNVWYRVVAAPGVEEQTPLLLLHGGPGAGHDYLEPLEALADERPVVVWDQLGCGKSDKPDDVSLWTHARFVREVDQVRAALGLERVHLLGQSWGGWLAIEYLLTAQPRGLVSLTLASTSASTAQFVREAHRLIDALPAAQRDAILRAEASGDWSDPTAQAGVETFYARHLCRLEPLPDPVLRTVANLDGNQVYLTMNGPNEFTVVGSLKEWDRTEQLGEIRLPTLITVGRHDEIPPVCAETMRARIPGSRMEIFEHSGHCAHIEEPERYAAVLRAFLRQAEGG
jgi:proline-specific peptidase